MAEKTTKHMIVDLKTGFAYGLKLSAKGECKAIQPLNTVIKAFDGRTVAEFGPLADVANDDPSTITADTLPYGKTTYAVELIDGGAKTGKLFTLKWPTKEAANKGDLPAVGVKELPEDLVKAGLAAAVKGDKNAKGAGVNDEQVLKEALENIDRMIGLDSAKRDIRQNIAVARFNKAKEELGLSAKPISRHMVFTGNPGTGKTTFAREVAKVYHALGFIEKPEVHEVKRKDLVAGFVGQTALETMKQIEKAKGGILFIDEAYSLAQPQGPNGNDFGKEAIDTLVAEMENMRDNLIVIVAGYTEPMKRFINSNEGLKSRFMTYIDFDDYALPELGKIMDVMLKERGYTMTEEAREHSLKILDEEKIRAKEKFGNGRTVRNLVEAAEKAMAQRLDDAGLLGKVQNADTPERRQALTTITLSDVRAVKLEGLSEKKEASIGFGSSKPARPFNDNARPPAPAVQRGAAPAKISFGI